MKKYIIISGFNIKDNNRGTAALSYGAISFLDKLGYLADDPELLNIRYANKIWKYRSYAEILEIQGKRLKHICVYVSTIEKKMFDKVGILLPWTKFGKVVRNVRLVANINGGDGFSDIYGTDIFLSRLPDTKIALKRNIPYILLPQTIGPFKAASNKKMAEDILLNAKKIFVRDDKYIKRLEDLSLNYELTKDLSAFMKPERWNIDIIPESIGLNISGLALYNKFPGLEGQFDNYRDLILGIIDLFLAKGKSIYLISHSYNFNTPEKNNDDLAACKDIYQSLSNTENVVLVNEDLTPPQIKYVISKMSFFIGTRMHANFAAMYTGVPLYGLAYSYKFKGAFDANGLNGDGQTSMINNISKDDINSIIKKIESFWNKV